MRGSIFAAAVFASSAASAACPALSAPITVAIDGFISDIAIDPACENVFVANQELGRVDVYALATGARVRTAWTGSKPRGLDFSLNGSRFFVSSEGARKIAIIDVATGAALGAIPAPGAADFPISLAAGADGSILFVSATDEYFSGQVYQWNPFTDQVTALTAFQRVDAMTRLRANAPRTVIGVGGLYSSSFAPGMGRFTVSSGAADVFAAGLQSLTDSPGLAFSATGKEGVGAFSTQAFTLQDLKRTKDLGPLAAFDAAISADGTRAFFTITGDKLRVVGLADPSRTGFIPLGAPVAGTTGKIALSADASLAVIMTDRGISIVSTAARAPDALTLLANSSAFEGPQSLLRFYNNSGPGTATVTLADPATGAVLTTWKSPPIGLHAATQYAINTIEAAASASFAKPPRYLVTVKSDFSGTFSHVVWRPGQAITNVTSCDVDSATDGILSHVHSSTIDTGYRSYISIHNPTLSPMRADFSIYPDDGSTRAGTYSLDVAGGAGTIVSMRDIESSARLTPAAARPPVSYYSLQTAAPTALRLQHLVQNDHGGVLVDMTPACALPYTRLTPG